MLKIIVKILDSISLFFQKRELKGKIKSLENSRASLSWMITVEKNHTDIVNNAYVDVCNQIAFYKKELEKLK